MTYDTIVIDVNEKSPLNEETEKETSFEDVYNSWLDCFSRPFILSYF